VLWLVPVLLLAGAVIAVLVRREPSTASEGRGAKVTRTNIVKVATAVGRIEVLYEVPVNSLWGGIMTRLEVKLGQRVAAGDPLAEVRPVLTQQGVLAAERSLEQARIGEAAAREYVDQQHVASYLTRFFLGENSLERQYQSAQLARRSAEEQLELLRKGEASSGDRQLDYVIRAPVAGHVIDIRQRPGAPIVPSSLYGTGSEFLTLADMDRLVFRGTVDEIDAGKLKETMVARVKVGSLPGAEITATLTEIALKSTVQNNATVFPVLMEVHAAPGIVLRSGYSAVAEIEIERRQGILTLPERMVEFRNDQAFVRVPCEKGRPQEREISTGLSDGLTVEITAGLAESDEVLEWTWE
jgi:HlyD family secretion protein